jgi:pimeloyl-ACP methyl ester carboxylesterase
VLEAVARAEVVGAALEDDEPPVAGDRDVDPAPEELGEPVQPLLYLQGADDGCLDSRWAARVSGRLPAGGRAAVIADAGHFLQYEQPEIVNRLIVDFLGA